MVLFLILVNVDLPSRESETGLWSLEPGSDAVCPF